MTKQHCDEHAKLLGADERHNAWLASIERRLRKIETWIKAAVIAAALAAGGSWGIPGGDVAKAIFGLLGSSPVAASTGTTQGLARVENGRPGASWAAVSAGMDAGQEISAAAAGEERNP